MIYNTPIGSSRIPSIITGSLALSFYSPTASITSIHYPPGLENDDNQQCSSPPFSPPSSAPHLWPPSPSLLNLGSWHCARPATSILHRSAPPAEASSCVFPSRTPHARAVLPRTLPSISKTASYFSTLTPQSPRSCSPTGLAWVSDCLFPFFFRTYPPSTKMRLFRREYTNNERLAEML